MTHSSHFGESPEGRRISLHAKIELMDGHTSTDFSSPCSQTLIKDQKENVTGAGRGGGGKDIYQGRKRPVQSQLGAGVCGND